MFCSLPALIFAGAMAYYFYNQSQAKKEVYEERGNTDLLFGVFFIWCVCIVLTFVAWIFSTKPMSEKELVLCIEEQRSVQVMEVNDGGCSLYRRSTCERWEASFSTADGQFGTAEYDDRTCVVVIEPSEK